jgi:hypothetical protein
MSTDKVEQTLDEQRLMWQSLISNEGWKELLKVLDSQIQVRLSTVMLTSLESHDQTLAQEFCKGEYAAFNLIKQLPDNALETVEYIIEENKRQRKDEESK